MTWGALQQTVRSGAVQRVHRGVYAMEGADRALVGALCAGGVVTGPAAARLHGLAVLTEHPPWVAVPLNGSRRRAVGVRVVRLRLSVEERAAGVTTPLTTVLVCARLLPLREALVIADSALRLGLGAEELVAAAPQRGRGSNCVRRVVQLADGRAESVIETCIRLVLLELGCAFEVQVRIRGLGRVDFLIEGWLVVEADGFAYHSSRADYRNDRRRDRVVMRAGYSVVRFSYEEAVYTPDVVAEEIRSALSLRFQRRGEGGRGRSA